MDHPNFIIPVGTQVVLRSAKRIPGTDQHKPVGTVAEVLEASTNNERFYKIRFVDGVELRVKFGELAIRRREVGDELATPGEDLRRYVIYRVMVGSRAFGLATEGSDEDRRGVFLPPAERSWSLFRPPEQVEYKGDGVEEVDWELEKFLRLALQANPNILETLWSPCVLQMTDVGRELRELRTAFLMKQGVERKGTYKAKHAMHLIRLLHSGTHALREGDIRVDVAEHRAELMEIRGGGLPFERVRNRAMELDREFQAAFAKTKLPERPDYERVDRFLIEARRSAI